METEKNTPSSLDLGLPQLQRQGVIINARGETALDKPMFRRSLLVCRKLHQKNGKELAEVVTAALQAHPVETITSDRGSEFIYHEQITQGLGGIQFYFALPRHPWQRGTNENTNGLLREFFPKGSCMTNVSTEFIQTVEDELNLRPRKILGFRTPTEVRSSLLLHLT